MATDARAYRNTLLTLWVVLAAIAYFVSRQQHIPTSVAAWLTAAFLVELAFYLGLGFAWSKALVDSIEPPPVRALMLMLSALIPYLIYALGTGTFHWRSLGFLALIATITSAWFVFFKRPFTDILFCAILAVLILSNVFDSIYVTLARKADAPWLGRLMLVHTSVFAATSIRRLGAIGFRFVPNARDWIIGLTCYAGAFVSVYMANIWIKLVHVQMAPGPWWRVAGLGIAIFLGFLWVGSISEEFITRGILQQTLTKQIGVIKSILITAVIFGLVHLPFAHKFPNWPQAAMAGILGIFCGIAYQRAGNIRASTITHALVVATWRTFFA